METSHAPFQGDHDAAPATRQQAAHQQVAPGVVFLRLFMVNVYFVKDDGGWVLVDAGLPLSAGRILAAARARFGPNAGPRAIVLTHGHFDHVGALRNLAETWDVPVYAHPLELPYLSGRSSYPPPDPSVGGGLMAYLSFLFPRGPVDLGNRLRPLPPDGSLPFLPEWRWLHTPGHTPGHVSLFRERDRTLIAGDACITVRQESATAVVLQRQVLHGPPAYYTQDWEQAQASVRQLANLRPALLAPGHGFPLGGERLFRQLSALTRDFRDLAVPPKGRYVDQPALADEQGTVTVPAGGLQASLPKVLAGLGVALLVYAFVRRRRKAR